MSESLPLELVELTNCVLVSNTPWNDETKLVANTLCDFVPVLAVTNGDSILVANTLWDPVPGLAVSEALKPTLLSKGCCNTLKSTVKKNGNTESVSYYHKVIKIIFV